MTAHNYSAAIIALACGLCAASSAHAQPGPEPFAPSTTTLEGWAEDRFGKIAGSCLPGSGDGLRLQQVQGDNRLSGDPKRISAVPKMVRDGLGLNSAYPHPLLPFGDVKVTGVFGYVYSSAEQTQPIFTPGSFLDIDYAGDKDQIVDPKHDLMTYTNDCRGVLTAALEANTGYSFPLASVKAFFSTNGSTNNQGRASVVAGRFVSPLFQMWSGFNLSETYNRSGARFYTAVLFWDYYNRSQKLTDNYLLEYADGASLYRFLDSSSSASFEVKSGGGLALPFVTAKAEVGGQYRQGSETHVQDLEFVIHKGADRHRFQPLPPVGSVLQAAADYRGVRVVVEGGDTLQPGVARGFYQDVSYLPAAYCEADSWKAVPTTPLPAGATLAVEDADQTTNAEKQPICRFRLVFTPEVFTAEAPLTVNYRLEVANIGDRAKVAALALAPQKVAFRKSLRPDLHPSVGAPSNWVYRPTTQSLEWVVSYNLRDDGKIASVSEIDLRDLSLKCEGAAPPYAEFTAAFQGTPSPTAANKVVRLTVAAGWEGAIPEAAWATTPCEIVGPVRFGAQERQLRAGGKVLLPVAPT